jgi:oligoribonuclease
MKFVSIDVETTGIDPEIDEILSIGAVIEDTENILPYEELPKFHVAILHEKVTGSLYALNMNRDLIEDIVSHQCTNSPEEREDIEKATGMKFLQKEEVSEAFFQFLYIHGISNERPDSVNIAQHVKMVDGHLVPMINMRTKPVTITAAGKNFGTFDKRFLEKLPRWNVVVRFRNRIIDPAVLYVDWKNDDSLPSLDTCKERAGIPGNVTHNALEDAWDTLQVIRAKY